MGADLYIKSEYEHNLARWTSLYDYWVDIRDELIAAGKASAADKARKKVAKYRDKMLTGYFRDNYTYTNLLLRFGLSWGEHVTQLIDDRGRMAPQQAKVLLDLLSALEHEFKDAIKGDPDRKEFIHRYKCLKAFLRLAIAKKEDIVCCI